MEIERIEDWIGQDVVDPDGEKVGKLEDVYYAGGGQDAVLGAVKTGLLGRKLSLVPLAQSSVTREHIRIAHSKQQVKDAPDSEGGDEVSPGEAMTVSEAYGVSAGSGPLESARARARKREEAREASARADELEKEAERKRQEAESEQAAASQRAVAAENAEKERDAAAREAEEARRRAEGR